MSAIRDNYREVQIALGLPAEFATGIPNDATRIAFDAKTAEALRDYRESQSGAGTPATPNVTPGGATAPAFTIVEGNWLGGVKRVQLSTGREFSPLVLVIHFTAGASGGSSIDSMRNNGLSAHLVIDRDGTVTQCVPFNRTASHAGVSRWREPVSGQLHSLINGFGIGIELANAGEDDGALSWARKQPGFKSIRARHRNGGPEAEWESFYEPQMMSLVAVASVLCARYRLLDITGHDCIAPERKSDPGPAFPMEQLRVACGFRGLPVVHRA